MWCRVDGTEGEGGEEAHYESTAVFEPVVQLKEVETKTHEEEEDVLYKMYVTTLPTILWPWSILQLVLSFLSDRVSLGGRADGSDAGVNLCRCLSV